MQIRVCASKIHRAKVTGADLNYVGSITIDRALMESANIKPYQMVIINNLSNAASWQTYAIPGEAGKGDVILNGPPARIFQKGDVVVILAEAYLEPEELKDFVPVVVFADENNRPAKVERHTGLFQ